MNARYRESIDQVLNSLDEMSGLHQTDVPHERAGHLINMAHWYGEIYEEMEKYFALNANKVLNEIFWAANGLDRKSTRLNSSHVAISYGVFCLKKKNQMYL